MGNINWGALFLAVVKAEADIKANRAPPAPGASPDAATLVSELATILPQWQAAWKTHAGYVTGLADILAALDADGVPYAGIVRQALLSAPGAMDEAEKFLPTVEWALTMFQPAATGISGDDHHIGRG